MKKYIKNILILSLLLGFLFSANIVSAQTSTTDETEYSKCFKENNIPGDPSSGARVAEKCGKKTGAPGSSNSGLSIVDPFKGLAGALANGFGIIIFNICSWILGFASGLLDWIMAYTVVDFSANVKDMAGIGIIWATIRNLINLSFIFILLYEGFKGILFGKADYGKTISKIVTTALLINFSLFFVRALIDISNIITLFFYSSIVGSGKICSLQDQVNILSGGDCTSFSRVLQSGLRVDSFYNISGIKGIFNFSANNIIVYIMGSILMLVASFVMFSIGMLFLVRYMTFVVLMALSPIGLAWEIPLLGKNSSKFWEVLQNQCIWPPVYMLFTWIIISLISSPGFITGYTESEGFAKMINEPAGSSVGLFANYVVVIGLLIFSLTYSKQMATKGDEFLGKAHSFLTKTGAGIGIGAAAWGLRNTAGRVGGALSNSQWLKDKAENGGAFAKFTSKKLLKYGDSASKKDFDARGTAVFDELAKRTGFDAGKSGDFLWRSKAGEGGYAGVQDRKIKKGNWFREGTEDAEKFAKMLGYSEEEVKKAKEQLLNQDFLKKENEERIKWKEKLRKGVLQGNETEKEKELITKHAELQKSIDAKLADATFKKIKKEYDESLDEKNLIKNEIAKLIKSKKGVTDQKTLDTINKQIETLREDKLTKAEKASKEKKEKYDDVMIDINRWQAGQKAMEDSFMTAEKREALRKIGGQEEVKKDGYVTQEGVDGRGAQYLKKKAEAETSFSPLHPLVGIEKIAPGLFSRQTEKAKALKALAKKLTKKE